jgi:tetratricopeptide (TPR) repeat protein
MDAGRYEAARSAHARYYALFMEQAWSRILLGQQREVLLDIEADIENVRTAWRNLVVQGDSDDALKMIRSLWSVHEIWGWYVAGEEIFADAVNVAGRRPANAGLRALVAMAESAQAWFVALLGRPAAGAALAERATSALRELGRADELAFADSQMFMSLYLSADNSRVKQIGQEVLELTSDPWLIANVHTWLAYVATNEGNLTEHEAHLAIMESLIESSGDYWLRYWLYLSKAVAALRRGDFARGREHLEHTLTIVKAVNMKRGLHHTLYNLGITARAMSDYNAAQKYLLQSMRVSEELGGKRDIASALVDLAIVLLATGETERALELAAAAYAHPLSVQVTIWNPNPVRERAVEVLQASLEGPIHPEAAQAAWQRGLAADFDRLVEDLIATSPRGDETTGKRGAKLTSCAASQ